MSTAGKSFGTNSPPSEINEEPLGVCSIRGDKPRSLSDADQRRAYCHSGTQVETKAKGEKGVQVPQEMPPSGKPKMKKD